MATVILLNGAGSAGKSSIASALQDLAAVPFLHVAMDTFLEMLPERYQDHPDGISYETTDDGNGPSTRVLVGPIGQTLLDGMRDAIAALAEAGNDLVVDDVMLGDEMAAYDRLLAGHRLLRIGVFAPLATLEEREQRRGDRIAGLARWQHDRVHAGKTYDLELDTAAMSSRECAAAILRLIET